MENKLQSTSQTQTCTQKRSWSLFGGLIYYSFLSPSEAFTSKKHAQQIDELHGKLQSLQPAFINRSGPILLQDNIQLHVAQPILRKLNNLDYEVFPHPPHSPDLSPTNYHFFKHLDNFLRRKCFLNQQEAENAFQESVKFQSMNFYATAINKFIFHWQKCIDCNGSHFD